MSVLFGTYECKLDAKGRFMLPSGLRSQIADGLPEGLVIKRSVFQKGWIDLPKTIKIEVSNPQVGFCSFT